MADAVTPVLTGSGCKQDLPAWGVTREFRFGQFVQLFDERIVNGKRQVTPLKLNSDGDVTELPDAASSTSAVTAVSAPRSALPLQALAADNIDEAAAGAPNTTITVTDVERLIRDATVQPDNGPPMQVELGPETASALRNGDAVHTVAYTSGRDATVIRLEPTAVTHVVAGESLDAAFAARGIDTDHGFVRLDDIGMRQLLDTGELTAPAWREDRPGRLVKLRVENLSAVPSRPLAERMAITDVAEFLAAPVLPTTDGRSVPVQLNDDAVRQLRLGQQVTVRVGDTDVVLGLRAGPDPVGPDVPVLGKAYPLDPKYLKYDLYRLHRELYGAMFTAVDTTTSTGTAGGTTGTSPPQAPALSRTGLQVAILLPWRQTWTLEGFSRGNLLSSLALAPSEETRITVAAWERRAKALEQTAETETEQTFDYTSTTRDTEDVFREMVQSNEFSAQAHASLDASYSNGVATVRLGASGDISSAASLLATARTSTEHVRETTSRAATRVRARRITRIAESFERTTTTETVRTIRNPNQCHTLTLNFHEVLAHYALRTAFDKGAVRIVVLVPNPHHVVKFDQIAVRAHEATLREGLLDAGLADGFAACRLLEAYRRAEDELRRLAGMAKAERELDRQRETPPDNTKPKPVNPFLAPMTQLLRDIATKFAPFPGSDVMPALKTIASWKTPPPGELSSANRWLWMRLVATKFGTGLVDALGGISSSPGPDDARRLVAALPPPGSFPALDGLGQLPDKDKEDAGLYSAVASNFSAAWWWWYPRLKDGRMYDVTDAGLPGLLGKLKDTFQQWEAKAAEGEGQEKADAVLSHANAEQQQVTLADRLEMKFGAEVVGSAMERAEALLAHLNEYVDYYRYVLFQGMPPSEQLRRLMDVAPQLRVGMFEPHVVASDGPNLAVPLTPLAETTLAKVVSNLAGILEQAATEAEAAGNKIAVDHVILTTPGVSVESWLGQCSGCDDQTEQLRAAEIRQAEAEASLLEVEAARRQARLDAKPPLLDAPEPALPAIRVQLDSSP
jgi:hypothetical protein